MVWATKWGIVFTTAKKCAKQQYLTFGNAWCSDLLSAMLVHRQLKLLLSTNYSTESLHG